MDDQSASTLIKRVREPVSTRVDQELVMMDIASGKYFGLNMVATRIWELLSEPMSLQNLLEALASEFEADDTTIAADVSKYLKELKAANLIEYD